MAIMCILVAWLGLTLVEVALLRTGTRKGWWT